MARSIAATKHFHLARTLRREFREMRPGDTVYTVEQLKNRFTVSQATVTRALDQLCRDGVIHRPAGRARYVIAEIGPRALHRVSIVRPTWPSPDYDAITRALITLGEAKGWAFEVYANQNDLEDLDLNRAIGDNDGAILLPSADRVPEHLRQALRKPRRPAVLVSTVSDNEPFTGVSLDDVDVGVQCTNHLLSLGHRRILVVLNEPSGPTIFDRTRGYRRAMSEAGITDTDALTFDCSVRPAQDSIKLAYDAFGRFLKRSDRPEFSAVFCTAWTGALAVGRALREAGLSVPDDISMIAYAGESIIVPYLNPPLTAVELNMSSLAEVALNMLERSFNDPHAEPQQVKLTGSLVVRGSTAPFRSAHGSV